MSMTVRPLRRPEARAAVALAARAFADDPLYAHVYPDPGRRQRSFRVEYRAALRHVFFPAGVVDALETDDGLAGVALWKPDGARVPWWRELRMMPAMVRAVGLGNLSVAQEAFEALDAAVPDERHHYLGLIAVDPERQGGGLGGALLRAGLDRADADGLPCFLQTGTWRSIRFYQRHGFRVTAEVAVPDGPRHWGMWRDPGAR